MLGENMEFVVVPSRKAFTFLLLVFLWGLRSGHSQSYDEMKSLNASCSPDDTCSPSRKLEDDNLIRMNCECKSSCARYGTCCLDSPYIRKSQTKQPLPSSPDLQYSCEPTADETSAVFMISKCKRGWQQDHDIKSLCESNVYDYKDPLSLVPYTNPKSSTTYKNYYCAFCNEDTDDSVPWNLDLEFKMRSVYEKYKEEVNQIFDDLVYDSYYQQWGVKVHAKETSHSFSDQEKDYPSFVQQENIHAFFFQQENAYPSFMQQENIEDIDNDSEHFEPIQFYVYYPHHIQDSITFCDSNLVADCSPNWSDKTIQDKCRSFMGTVYANVKSSFGFPIAQKFRNVYCAICNFIPDISSISCENLFTASRGVGAQHSIDVNIGKVVTCPEGEKYIHGRCRIVG